MSFAGLIEVLSATRRLVTLPASDFTYSGWEDQADALRDIDVCLKRLREGDQTVLKNLELLFAPTGPLQELSLSSGWAKSYLDLAEEFDTALKRV